MYQKIVGGLCGLLAIVGSSSGMQGNQNIVTAYQMIQRNDIEFESFIENNQIDPHQTHKIRFFKIEGRFISESDPYIQFYWESHFGQMPVDNVNCTEGDVNLFYIACMYNNPRIARLLLDKYHVDGVQQNPNGQRHLLGILADNNDLAAQDEVMISVLIHAGFHKLPVAQGGLSALQLVERQRGILQNNPNTAQAARLDRIDAQLRGYPIYRGFIFTPKKIAAIVAGVLGLAVVGTMLYNWYTKAEDADDEEKSDEVVEKSDAESNPVVTK